MAKIFKNILVTAEPEPDCFELLDAFEELAAINEEMGEGHGYTMIAQVFQHKHSDVQFYLTGCILSPDQSVRIQAILMEAR